jgi:hypothetical protein
MTVLAHGTLQPDGVTIRLDHRIELPPGKIVVTAEPAPAKTGETMLELLDRIHRERAARGERGLNEEEMAARIAEMRADDEEYEARWREIYANTTSPPEPKGR